MYITVLTYYILVWLIFSIKSLMSFSLPTMDQQSPQKPPYVQLRKLHGSGKQEAQVLILASAPDSPTFLVQNIEFLNFLILQMKKKNHT